MTAPEFLDCPLTDLIAHPANIRRDVGDVSTLAASIKAQGLLHPLMIAPTADPDADSDRYVVLAGHRRLAAASAAGLTVVPCVLHADMTDPADQIAVMLSENGERADLTPAEEATGIQAMLDLGESVATISKRTGMAKTRVRQRAKIADLDDKVLQKLHSHDVTIADAVFIAENPDYRDDLEKSVGTKNWAVDRERVRKSIDRDKRIAEQLAEAKGLGIMPLPEASTWQTRQAMEAELGVPIRVEHQGQWDASKVADLDLDCHRAYTTHLGYEENLTMVILAWDPDAAATGGTPTDEDLAAQEEVVREQIERQQEDARQAQLLEAAETVRREFLRNLPDEVKGTAAGKALNLAVANWGVIHRYEIDWWLVLPDLDDSLDEAAIIDLGRDWLESASTTDIAWALARSALEGRIDPVMSDDLQYGSPARQQEQSQKVIAYADFLTSLGYDLSDVELKSVALAVAITSGEEA